MISKNTVKLIHSLSLKKYRKKENLFLVEGDKNVQDILRSNYQVTQLFATQAFISENEKQIKHAQEISEVDHKEIKKASLLKNPQNCIALCKIPEEPALPEKITGNLTLYLDGIQDPGNLGTILRISDWFGIETIFCSPDTADIYNPKVVQASMGSICRTKVIYTEFDNILKTAENSDAEIAGAFLSGENIYTENLKQNIVLVVGNEGNGIRPELESQIKRKIKIPFYSQKEEKAESLNVAVATGIICSEIKRQQSF